MPSKTTRREFWNGDPERLPDGFTLTKPKGDHVLTAVCEVWTHEMGWELRLQVDGQGLLMSSLTRSGAGDARPRGGVAPRDDREGLELMPCHCADGWICEQHPDRPWPHDSPKDQNDPSGNCAGPGMLCQNPECPVGRVLRAELDARRQPSSSN